VLRCRLAALCSGLLLGSTLASGQGAARKPPPTVASQNVLSFAAGTVVVQRPSEHNDTYTALMLLDESPRSIWSSAKGQTTDQRITLQLAERSVIRTLVFDTAGADRLERSAKDIAVEISDQGPTSGFAPLVDVSLVARTDQQRFHVTTERAGRWVRLTVRNNHGDPDFVELGEVRGEGAYLTQTPPARIGGTYRTRWPGGSADMHVRQQGALVAGCYEHLQGTFTGGLENRLMRFSWRQTNGVGLAVMVVSADGQRLNGLFWGGNRAEGQAAWWDGTKTADTAGECAHWKGTSENVMTAELRDAKRSRLYGVAFDFGAHQIRPDSRATLDQVAGVLKANGGWRITIEGHTDNVGGEQANQLLSERRAAAVRAYLVAAGIDAGRLAPVGFGAQRPLASNETDLGRAQNRRVELVRD
jgi:outer membrane protein OmpA-like peptidoglycan-associated protein